MADPMTKNPGGSGDEKSRKRDKKEPMDWHASLAAFLDVRWPQADPNTPFDIQQDVKIGPQQVRMAVVRKQDGDLNLEDPIVSSFKKYQLIECERLEDELDTRTLYGGLGYAVCGRS